MISLVELIKREVANMLGLQAKTQYGTITAYDPNKYVVKVKIQPDGPTTGWLPLTAPWVGSGYGAVFGPPLGTDCRIDFIDGNQEVAIAGARFFNVNNQPPVVQSGQAAIVDGAASYVKLNNDGTITMGCSGNMTIDSPHVICTGDLSDKNDAHGTLDAFRTTYDGHTHSDPQGGTVPAPNETI